MPRLENRAGKAVSLGRLALSLFILAAALIAAGPRPDWQQPAIGLCVAYVLFAAAVIAMTWPSWWLDHRLRLPSHLVDLVFFFALDILTGLYFDSPFFLFFVFLILSAGASWRMNGALLTAIAVALLVIAEMALFVPARALTAEAYGWAIARMGHLLVLTWMVAWLETRRRGGRTGPAAFLPEHERHGPPVPEGLEYLARGMQASAAAMVWSDDEEPWTHLARWSRQAGHSSERLDPGPTVALVHGELEDRAFLFDIARRRALFADTKRFCACPRTDAFPADLAAGLGFAEGVAAPFAAGEMRGYVAAGGIAGMCREDLEAVRNLALDLSHGFERSATLRATSRTAESQVRLAIARNLHDSVTQLLAGVALKVKAVRSTQDEVDRDLALADIQGELVRHQRYLHDFIADLRQPAGEAGSKDFDEALGLLCAELEEQWNVQVPYRGVVGTIPRLLVSEISFMVREAVANAVRHGGADRVEVEVVLDEDGVMLRCSDNGRGHAAAAVATSDDHAAGPRSIQERAGLLGGVAELTTGAAGASVMIRLPLGMPAQ